MKKIKNKGILFWITGLSGSGKTTIAKKITPNLRKKYGPTILISADQIRAMFDLKKYNRASKIMYGHNFSKLAKFLTDQGFNVVLNVIGMFRSVRKRNRSNIKNYIEIYIETDLKKIIKIGKKKTYKNNKKNIVGKDIKAELPKKPNIIIKNDFTKNINQISKELLKKIDNLLKK